MPTNTRREWSLARRVALVVAAIVIAAAGVIVFTNPFSSHTPSSAGVTDNSYPTTTTHVTRRSLTSQTQVSATLGYAGSYTVTIPSGSSQSDVSSAQQAVQSDQHAVATDQSTLTQAQAKLTADQQLGCPAASAATVTTPGSPSASTGSSSGNANGGGGGGNAGSGSTGNTGSSGSKGGGTGNTGAGGTGNSGNAGAHTTAALTSSQGSHPVVAPQATTGSASPTDTTVMLSGTVDTGGAATSYTFEWGRTSALSNSTPVKVLPPANGSVSVTATLTGLAANTTYAFRLVATNSAGTSNGVVQTFATAASSCVAQTEVVSQDLATLNSDEASLAAANQALTDAQSRASNSNTTFTSLPNVGAVVKRGQAAYSLDQHPVPLFYGTTTPWRSLYLGVSDGPDVMQLDQNLVALGFGSGLTPSETFTAATATAVEAWQSSIGMPATGVVNLGDIVVAPGPVQVDSVSAALGSQAAGGSTVFTATSRTPIVTIALDASEQSQVKVGDPVTITLPDSTTTPGVVSSVGTVATSSGGAGNTGSGGSNATITVLVRPTKLSAAAGLDQASVEVAITTGSVNNALVVPVDALLALASGGYAVEVVEPGGAHHLVGVTPGLFDDAAGLVQVNGNGLSAGQRVVVPKV